MNTTPEELVKALRTSLKENERLKRENREYLAADQGSDRAGGGGGDGVPLSGWSGFPGGLVGDGG